MALQAPCSTLAQQVSPVGLSADQSACPLIVVRHPLDGLKADALDIDRFQPADNAGAQGALRACCAGSCGPKSRTPAELPLRSAPTLPKHSPKQAMQENHGMARSSIG